MTTVGSLCSGVGGLDLAVCAHYGAEVAWHAETDPYACKVLAARWPGVPNLGDITTTDWCTVPTVDVLCAGWPCQPFSTAGRREGTDDERHLWPHVADAVRVLRPRILVGENVRGHLSLGFDLVLADLADMGYVGSWGVVPAAAIGAPHRRERLFVVAYADGQGRKERQYRRGRHLPTDSSWASNRPSDAAPPADAGSARRWEDTRSAHGDEGADAGGAESLHHELGRASEGGDAPWGPYQPAITRWERILGRPAPAPLVGRQLNARFVEWLMGLDEGWVTDLVRNRHALRLLGNGVVPQQAVLALELLNPVDKERAA